jgi:hypothetical protein
MMRAMRYPAFSMKTLTLAALLTLNAFSSAQAQSITYSTDKHTTPVAESSIRLLGKGYADKKDPTRSIALACIAVRKDEQCAQARFVYWQGQEANYIGQGFYIPYHLNKEGKEVINVEALQGALQILLQRTVGAHERAKYDRIFTIGAATAVTGVGLIVGIPLLGLIYSVLFILPRDETKGFKASNIAISAHDLDQVTRDQNGWNWSSEAKRIKTKLFDRVVSDLVETETEKNFYKVPRWQL